MFKENDLNFPEKANKVSGTGYETQIEEVKTNIEKEREKKERKENLEKIFNEQKQKLLDLGYPEALGMDNDDFLAKYIEPLRKKLDKVPENIPEGNIPFLIVIPDNILDIEKKMSMVRLGEKTGGSVAEELNDSEDEVLKGLKDAGRIKLPKNSYLIYDIEIITNKETIKGVSFNNSTKQFIKGNKRGLINQEGIALITHHPEILQNYGIDLLGSRCDSGFIGSFYVLNGIPELTYCHEKDAIKSLNSCPAFSCSPFCVSK